MFTEKEKETIRDRTFGPSGPLPLGLVTTGDPREADLEAFVRELQEELPFLETRHETAALPEMPALAVGRRILFHGTPRGPELAPFLAALAGDGKTLAPEIGKALGSVKLPAPLKLFISPQCPFCPEAARLLMTLAGACDQVTLAVIDAFLFPEMAEAEGIQSVPTAVLDRTFRWTGVPDPVEIVRAMADRDPAGLGADSLRGIIETGGAEQVARMMHESGKLFPAFFDLVTHDKWPVRLGAMVTMEYLADQDPDLAARGAEPLWQRFFRADEPVQGDILDVLGLIAPIALAAPIRAVAGASPNDEVREAAMEAAERIRQRHGDSRGMAP